MTIRIVKIRYTDLGEYSYTMMGMALAVMLMDRAKAVGIDPAGRPVEELEKKVAALEALNNESE